MAFTVEDMRPLCWMPVVGYLLKFGATDLLFAISFSVL